MPHRMGLLGKKIGMMQDFDEKGDWSTYTVVSVGPCVVLDIKTPERDGYSALKLGFDEKKAARVNRPESGVFAKAGTTPKRHVRELRLTAEECAQFEVGQTLTPEQVFRNGDFVDVTGTSRGKGFQGVMKRHHFGGFRATHGTHEYFRHGGSIGCRLTPGKVYKGRKMPGQMGNRRVTVQNVGIGKVLPEKNLVLLVGGIPGSPDGLVLLRHATKRLLPPFKLIEPKQPSSEGDEAAEQTAE